MWQTLLNKCLHIHPGVNPISCLEWLHVWNHLPLFGGIVVQFHTLPHVFFKANFLRPVPKKMRQKHPSKGHPNHIQLEEIPSSWHWYSCSKNKGTPKWMVYNGKPENPIKMDDLGFFPYFWFNTRIGTAIAHSSQHIFAQVQTNGMNLCGRCDFQGYNHCQKCVFFPTQTMATLRENPAKS